MCLVFLVTAGIVAAIAMKISNVHDDVAKLPGPEDNSDEVCTPSLVLLLKGMFNCPVPDI